MGSKNKEQHLQIGRITGCVLSPKLVLWPSSQDWIVASMGRCPIWKFVIQSFSRRFWILVTGNVGVADLDVHGLLCVVALELAIRR